jgi:hypothetical protein
MAINVELFPIDFPETVNDELTLEEAVQLLRLEALNTARRQSHTRRIGGQNDISNQSRLIPSRPILMPLFAVGSASQEPQFLGIAGYLGGGRGYGSTLSRVYELLFHNETFSTTGARLQDPRMYSGTLSNLREGLFCGGMGPTEVSSSIEAINFNRKTIARAAQQLTQPRQSLAGGIGNKEKGVLIGGYIAPRITGYAEKVVYGDPIQVSVISSTFLPVPRSAPHNGFCNDSVGYLYGGYKNLDLAPFISNTEILERINYTTTPETRQTVSVAIGNKPPHVVHACGGNRDYAYITAGSNDAVNASANWFSKDIVEFAYSGETISQVSATLPDGKVCADGLSSSSTFYIVGGDKVDSALSGSWTGTQTADKFTMSSKTCVRMESKLEFPQSDQGAVSDYGPGFSHG